MAFLVTAFVVVVSPGTGVLLSVAAGLRGGARHALVTAFGCTLGIVPHLVVAVAGAAALLRAGGMVFEGVKVLGVCYLLYLAWRTWRDTGALAVEGRPERRSAVRTIVAAILANLLNPKLTVFFLAFLPQFVSVRAAHPLLEMTLLSAVFMAMTFVVFALYGCFAGAARTHLIDRPAVVRRIRRTFSVGFVVLAGKLAGTAR